MLLNVKGKMYSGEIDYRLLISPFSCRLGRNASATMASSKGGARTGFLHTGRQGAILQLDKLLRATSQRHIIMHMAQT